MSNETIEAALQLGIALGKEEKIYPPIKAQADEEEDYQKQVAAIFNAASGFTKGLEKLRDMEGSTFTFEHKTVKENDAADVSEIIHFKTNIPGEQFGSDKEPPNVSARITIPREDYNPGCFGSPAYGSLSIETAYYDPREFYVDITSPQAVEKALTVIAKHAAKRGLIP